MSTLLLIIACVLVLLFVGGLVASRRRTSESDWSEHVAAADHALEAAVADDLGWDRELLDREARSALERERAGWSYGELHLVLVDDRPGVEEDRAHFVAEGTDGSEARIVLARTAAGDWHLESVS